MRWPAADCAPSPGARARAPPLTPFRRQSRPLSDDLLDGLPPTTSTSTLRTDHTSPLTCGFRLAAAHSLGVTSPTGSTHRKEWRRRRAVRHGFGRPPGYCREERRPRRRRRVQRCPQPAGVGQVLRALPLLRRELYQDQVGHGFLLVHGGGPRALAVPWCLRGRDTGCVPGAGTVVRAASRRAVTAGDQGPGRDRAAGAAAHAPGGGRRRGRRARPGAWCPRRCGGGRRRRG